LQTKGSSNIYFVDISAFQDITDEAELFSRTPAIYLRCFGTDHTARDSQFLTRVTMAKNHNVPSGAYYFGTPTTDVATDGGAEARAQADQFIAALQLGYGTGKYGDLIPILDIESWDSETKPMFYGMTGQKLINWIKVYRDHFFATTGRRLGFYSNRDFLTAPEKGNMTDTMLTEIQNMPFWLAEYDEWYPQNTADTAAPANIGGWTTYIGWQFTDDEPADQWGCTHYTNDIDLNRTDSLDRLMPPKPPTNVVATQRAGNLLEITFTKPAITDYLGASVYIDGVWKKWIAKTANSTTIDIASYSRGTHTFQVIVEDNYSDTAASAIQNITFVEESVFQMPKRTTGITATSLSNFVIDAGAVYINYGEVNERLLGATRGGNTFTIEVEMREMEIDGVRQAVKGTKRIISVVASMTVNLLELTAENLALALTGSQLTTFTQAPSPTPTHDVIKRIREIGTMDYVENIAVVGKVNNSAENFVGILYNALSSGGLELAMEDESEAAIELTFTAHIDPADIADDGSYPEAWEIRMPISAP
jgi:GH25 family lysozyme M1 (1,4-beta-N-acetylmuramidase)